MLRLMLLCLVVSGPAHALEFSSTEQATTVVELYTSEGCSSCPPADTWLSSMRDNPRLFKTLLPLAFHVDYWDRLGWKDRFAKAEFTDRQQALVQQGLLSQIYTPGIVVNSHEWRPWFRGQRAVPINDHKAGVLAAKLHQNKLTASYSSDEQLVLNVAYLGLGLTSRVEAGENRNRTLKHDFVVLQYWQQPGRSEWQLDLPDRPNVGQKQTALALWLSKPDSPSMIQAAGQLLE